MDLSQGLLLGGDPELHQLRDAGKRMADHLNAKIAFGKLTQYGRWMAFSLDDGATDDVVYDTRADAMKHQRHEDLCHYEALRPASYSADECALTLAYARAFHGSGMRQHDLPDHMAQIGPVRLEDKARKLAQLTARRS